jgi:hypothetical protein
MDKVNPIAFLKYKANIIGRPADTAAYRVVIDYIEALEAENAALQGQIEASTLPVKYFQEGGVVHAVYGSSSIAYVERLHAALMKGGESDGQE